MKYNGVNLTFDNLRVVLKDFSVDIQDVVRSALLDGISLEKYIDQCKNNPYRLDQIRLGMKEGINDSFFGFTSGEVIRGIRGLIKKGVNLNQMKKYKNSGLSDKCLLYLVYWCKDGFNVSNLNLSIIPDYLIEFFDYGIRHGFNMEIFNTGTQYSLRECDVFLRIMEVGCRVEKLCSGNWAFDVLEKLGSIANTSKSRYNIIYPYLIPNISTTRLDLFERAAVLGMDIKSLTEVKDGSYIALEESLGVVVEAYTHKIDLIGDLNSDLSTEDLKEKYNMKILEGNRKLSGKLRRSV